MYRRLRYPILICVGLLSFSCSKIGYVPLTDESVNLAMQEEHRETKKFLSKKNHPTNTKLPEGNKFMVKGLRRKPSKLPPGDKLHVVKKRVSSAEKKKYKQPRKTKNNP
jgi:hypothetical protein